MGEGEGLFSCVKSGHLPTKGRCENHTNTSRKQKRESRITSILALRAKYNPQEFGSGCRKEEATRTKNSFMVRTAVDS
jgi:hypothetical protein